MGKLTLSSEVVKSDFYLTVLDDEHRKLYLDYYNKVKAGSADSKLINSKFLEEIREYASYEDHTDSFLGILFEDRKFDVRVVGSSNIVQKAKIDLTEIDSADDVLYDYSELKDGMYMIGQDVTRESMILNFEIEDDENFNIDDLKIDTCVLSSLPIGLSGVVCTDNVTVVTAIRYKDKVLKLDGINDDFIHKELDDTDSMDIIFEVKQGKVNVVFAYIDKYYKALVFPLASEFKNDETFLSSFSINALLSSSQDKEQDVDYENDDFDADDNGDIYYTEEDIDDDLDDDLTNDYEEDDDDENIEDEDDLEEDEDIDDDDLDEDLDDEEELEGDEETYEDDDFEDEDKDKSQPR